MSKFTKNLLYFSLLFIVLFFLQSSPNSFGDPDGFYHVKIAEELSHGNILYQFPWLTATTWADRFADQHFLYHVILIPFVKLHRFIGPQLLNAALVTLLAFVFSRILEHFKVKKPLVWSTILIFSSQIFLLRVLLVKAVPLGLVWLFLCLLLLLKRKTFWLGLCSAAFVLSYGGFVFLPVLLGLGLLANLISRQKPYWSGYAAALAGIGLGLLLHPNSDNLFYHLYNQIFQAGLGYRIGVGGEWNPPTLITFLSGSAVVFAFWMTGFILLLERKDIVKKWTEGLLVFFLSCFFFALTAKSQRFAEYWVPVTVLFVAAFITKFQVLDSFLDTWSIKIRKEFFSFFPILLGASCLVVVLAFTTLSASLMVKGGANITAYQAPAELLAQYSQDDSIVFNTRWDHFPMLYFVNDQNRYISGMDPMFMYGRNPQKFWLWLHISQDETTTCEQRVCDETATSNLAKIIREGFNAEYLFLENEDTPNLKKYLESNQSVRKIYTDDFATVFELK